MAGGMAVLRVSYGCKTEDTAEDRAESPLASLQRGIHGSASWMISSSFGLCLAARPVRSPVERTRAGLGWPTRSRALALTALVAENFPGLRFVMARLSME